MHAQAPKGQSAQPVQHHQQQGDDGHGAGAEHVETDAGSQDEGIAPQLGQQEIEQEEAGEENEQEARRRKDHVIIP